MPPSACEGGSPEYTLPIHDHIIDPCDDEQTSDHQQRSPQILHCTLAPITYDKDIEIIIDNNPIARLSLAIS